MEQICGGRKLKGRNLVDGKSKIVHEMERVLEREIYTTTSDNRAKFLDMYSFQCHNFSFPNFCCE